MEEKGKRFVETKKHVVLSVLQDNGTHAFKKADKRPVQKLTGSWTIRLDTAGKKVAKAKNRLSAGLGH